MKQLLFLLILLSGFQLSIAQNNEAKEQLKNRGEVYFSVPVNDPSIINVLAKTVSIAQIEGHQLTAYANYKEFLSFLKLGLDYQVNTPPSLREKAPMKDVFDLASPDAWDYYPTYQAYENLMYQFGSLYPGICTIDTIGILPSGRKLLVARISQYVDSAMNKPQFLYSSSIHGDEISGYVSMLHLIDYLLINYGSDAKVTELVNNIDIFICPLANPDGTYAGGNNTVNGSTRYNANNVDMNRNYPDPQNGPHPDGNAWQPETVFFMDFASANHFVAGANFHCGAEVMNYPWDTWAQLSADDNWWQRVCRAYVDTVHLYSPASYFNDLNNGITNGSAWYEIDGGRQDYMNYFQYCREVTNELSNNGIPSGTSLLNLWNYNYRSFLNYMQECTYGVRGIVTDSVTGAPLKAKVFINGHDIDSSHVYSALPIGNYHRLLYPGTYNITFSKAGYYPKTLNGLTVSDFTANIQDVQLVPIGIGINKIQDEDCLLVSPNPARGFVMISSEKILTGDYKYCLYNSNGEVELSGKIKGEKLSNAYPLDLGNLSSGLYLLRFTNGNNNISKKLIVY